MSSSHELENDIDIDVGGLFGTLWRKRGRLLLLGLVAAIATFALLQVLSPLYRSEARILIESRDRNFTRDNRANTEQQRAVLDQEGVASQVQVITSRDVARAVIKKLDLAKLPEFDTTLTPSVMTDVLAMLGLINNPLSISPEERVLKVFNKKLSVIQVLRSRVINIKFSTKDQKLAASIPNEMAEEYLRIQTRAKQGVNDDEAAALEPQIEKLRAKVREAESRVADYRASSDLLLGRNNASLATQQLSDMSSELSRVRALKATADAKVASIEQALGSGASIDSNSDVLSAPLIQRLRERQVALRAQIAELSATLLPGHPRIRSLQSQLNNLDRQIRKEAQKILASLRNDAAVARSREKALKANLNTLKAESARVGEEQVELRALQREATSQRELLQNYLRRFREATSRQAQNFLAADARIISRATLPFEPYFPKTLPMVAAAFLGVILLSSLFILAGALLRTRPAREAVIMTSKPVAAPGSFNQAEVTKTGPSEFLANDSADLADEGPSLSGKTMQGSAAVAAKSISMLGKARIALLSPEGEVGSEGSVLLARYLATGGASVIAVDMTGAGASSHAMIGPSVVPGIKDLLAGEATFGDVIHSDRGSRAHIIPTGVASAEIAAESGDRLHMIFDALEKTYDYVVIDCGAADVAGLSRISKPNTINVINAIDQSNSAVLMAAEMLEHAGFRKPLIIHPSKSERQILATVAA